MIMDTHSNSYCEAWINGTWKVMPVQVARTRPALVVRCLECHGPIVLMQAGRNNTTRAHAEHRPGHTGCSLGHYFDGTSTPHPQQVEAPNNATDELKGDYGNLHSGNSEIEVRINEDLADLELENEYFEGHKKSRLSSFYERNPKLRLAAIKTHGLSCKVCGFDFKDFYGDHGSGFIEVHHLKPVSTLEASTKLSPENDMTVVCSNCHRMLHRNRDMVLTPSQLKTLLRIP